MKDLLGFGILLAAAGLYFHSKQRQEEENGGQPGGGNDNDPNPDDGGGNPSDGGLIEVPSDSDLSAEDLGLIVLTEDMTLAERAAALAHNKAILDALMEAH